MSLPSYPADTQGGTSGNPKVGTSGHPLRRPPGINARGEWLGSRGQCSDSKMGGFLLLQKLQNSRKRSTRDESVATRLRRLDGQGLKLRCPVSVSCTECNKCVYSVGFHDSALESSYCQPKMCFQLQVCKDDWQGCGSGVGYIKHFEKYHQEVEIQWPLTEVHAVDK